MLNAVMNNINANEFPSEAQVNNIINFKGIIKTSNITFYQFMKLTCKSNQSNYKKTYYGLCLSVLRYRDINKLDMLYLITD